MKKHTGLLIAILIIVAGCAPLAFEPEQATVYAKGLTLAKTATPKSPSTAIFKLTSSALGTGSRLTADTTCDGAGSTLPLQWSGAPKGTVAYAMIMHHNAPEGQAHWYWILYNIPAATTQIAKNSTGGGTLGTNSLNGLAQYSPPCPIGPGDKEFIFTLYALKSKPKFAANTKVDRPTLLAAIRSITLASTELRTVYARQAIITPTPASTMVPTKVPTQLPATAAPGYTIEQATSDKAQGMTIAFDAMAFLTGDTGADSFFPPGKLADYWGFQYLRDNDPSGMGHSGEFLTSAALNTLNILTAQQRALLVTLAQNQVGRINEYANRRFVLMNSFRRALENDLPSGTSGLSLDAIKSYSSDLYALDGEISYERAQVMGDILHDLTPAQIASFSSMKGKGMKEWPVVAEPDDLRGLDRNVKVAVMTYASDLLSWYNGSVEADVYFCPERHGTYYGSFYLKDIKAMGDPTYAIPTDLTGDLGAVMLQKMDSTQAGKIQGIVDSQRPALTGIVDIRQKISIELRKFIGGGTADKIALDGMFRQYGAYDGEINYYMATTFTAVGKTLTPSQQADLAAMRLELLGDLNHPTGAFLYSQPIAMPIIENSDFLFK